MIDCSHANSNKDHKRQGVVAKDVVDQIIAGDTSIIGLMIESNIGAGNQKLDTPQDLEYGVSITDACIDWVETESLLTELANQLEAPLRSRSDP
jgi:3-deoxy-7-phosphoheptulonate synthase